MKTDTHNQQSSPGTRPPKVVIIGAGIAGLTVAHELVKAGKGKFEIEVIEKQPEAGGKARTEWNDANEFHEHSMRVLPGSYVCMHQVMEEIKTPRGPVIKRLRPANIRFQHRNEKTGRTRRTEIRGAYGRFFIGRLHFFIDALKLLWFLWRSGVTAKELVVFLFKVGRLLWTPDRKVITDLSRLRFSDYVCGDEVTPGFEKIIFRIAEILVAAKSYASAGVVSRTLLEWFVTPFLRGEHVKQQVSEFDASTSEALIQPWVAWLEDQDVKFRFNTWVTEIEHSAGKITTLSVRDAQGGELKDEKSKAADEMVSADAIVLAVQHNVADALLSSGKEDLRLRIPELNDFPRLGEEWAHSVQFQLARLPGELREIGERSVAVVDSPWSIGYKVYSKETWRQPHWPAGDCEAILTATISNTQNAGTLTSRSFLQCSREEIIREVLHQTHLKDVLDKTSGDLGLDLDVVSSSEAAARLDSPANEYDGYAVRAIVDPGDHVFMSDAQMYIRLPGNLDIEPDNATGICNLFLAGEYTRTSYRIPTMEKSCESGKRCVQAILKSRGDNQSHDRVPSCDLPLPWIRYEGTWLILKIAFWGLLLVAVGFLLNDWWCRNMVP
jgi:uncharacterized protein with NAD-binding domain and iron-sulfur cluster